MDGFMLSNYQDPIAKAWADAPQIYYAAGAPAKYQK